MISSGLAVEALQPGVADVVEVAGESVVVEFGAGDAEYLGLNVARDQPPEAPLERHLPVRDVLADEQVDAVDHDLGALATEVVELAVGSLIPCSSPSGDAAVADISTRP
ncbi:hypothetical protein IMZ11_07190 [Microtetraspora sp. AC03309]|uniref:hypothetical protein n=1 Tax=Microtetraspora sp. AC03309 TaxID=2779376 RepID=UPI001E3D7B07|nr:hypothetical protein [Microtetraspora sp. AC03309]MCC5575427.1 hypothetical protein [Microtetraspora sp. AC03309]